MASPPTFFWTASLFVNTPDDVDRIMSPSRPIEYRNASSAEI